MVNYVNSEKFMAWYTAGAKEPLREAQALEKVYAAYCADCYAGRRSGSQGRFVIPAGESVSGKEESYDFRVENIGCCGASTIFVYF